MADDDRAKQNMKQRPALKLSPLHVPAMDLMWYERTCAPPAASLLRSDDHAKARRRVGTNEKVGRIQLHNLARHCAAAAMSQLDPSNLFVRADAPTGLGMII
jgi:hypothetical protein